DLVVRRDAVVSELRPTPGESTAVTIQTMHRLIAALVLLSALGCRAHGTAGAGAASRDTAAARALNDRAFELIGKSDYAGAEKLLNKSINADVMFGPAHNN